MAHPKFVMLGETLVIRDEGEGGKYCFEVRSIKQYLLVPYDEEFPVSTDVGVVELLQSNSLVCVYVMDA